MVFEAGSWTWLEVVKILASVVTPVVLAFMGVSLTKAAKRFEHSQWRTTKLIEKRLAVYDDIAPLLNDVLCYFTYVGSWNDKNPPEIVKLKRVIDKKIYLAQPLFTPDFFSACLNFQSTCYEMFGGMGEPARLKTGFNEREKAYPNWDPKWRACFSEKPQFPSLEEVRAAYKKVMDEFALNIGIIEGPIDYTLGHYPRDPR